MDTHGQEPGTEHLQAFRKLGAGPMVGLSGRLRYLFFASLPPGDRPSLGVLVLRRDSSLNHCFSKAADWFARLLLPSYLEKHQCLVMPVPSTWTAHSGKKTVEIKGTSRFRINSVSMVREMSVLGMGIAFLPERIVADDVAHGRLQRILSDWQGAPGPIYAVTETRLLPAKTQRFIEFLKEGCGTSSDWC